MGYKPRNGDAATRNGKAVTGGHVIDSSRSSYHNPRPSPVVPAASRRQNTENSCDRSACRSPAPTHTSLQQRGNPAGKTPTGVETKRREPRSERESGRGPLTDDQTVRRVHYAYGVRVLTPPAEPTRIEPLVRATLAPIRVADLGAWFARPASLVAEPSAPQPVQGHLREAARPIEPSIGDAPTPTRRSTLRSFRLSLSHACLARHGRHAPRRRDVTASTPSLDHVEPDSIARAEIRNRPHRRGNSRP
ncbi:hypothetical protein BDV93DRAFT_371632 [Ceratobasidium sp. AG-I]|nr:hypothetical protein BDV93DRAFT_371632 [Ceratobasidium sp. AG-I]